LAQEQGRAQQVLQLGQAAAERGLGDPLRAGRRRQAAAGRDVEEGAQMAQLGGGFCIIGRISPMLGYGQEESPCKP
jgi:hypothetical protein